MSHTPAATSKKSTSKQSVTASQKSAQSHPASAGKPIHDGENRQQMIATAAYFRAERRGFDGGDPMADWLDAEAEIDAMLKNSEAFNVH